LDQDAASKAIQKKLVQEISRQEEEDYKLKQAERAEMDANNDDYDDQVCFGVYSCLYLFVYILNCIGI
jgi:hypothetical protein